MPAPESPAKTQIFRPSDAHLNDVYEAFLNFPELAANHAADLRRRGLDDIALHLHGYKSLPTPVYANKLAERWAKEYALEGVPGFYYEKGAWKFQTYGGVAGCIVPLRNSKNQIVGLTIRTDDGQKWANGEKIPKYLVVSSANKPRGASAGAPHHFALLGRPLLRKNINRRNLTEIIVTEGALKANVIAEYVDLPVVGLVSVTTFDETFPHLLKEVFPRLETVHIAFDKEVFDPRNPAKCAFTHVRRQRERLVLTLEKIKLKTSILSWNSSAKGLDDHLYNQSRARQTA